MSVTIDDIIYIVDTSFPVIVIYNYNEDYVNNILFSYKNQIDSMENKLEIKGNKIKFVNGKAFKEFYIATAVPEVDLTIMNLSVSENQLILTVE